MARVFDKKNIRMLRFWNFAEHTPENSWVQRALHRALKGPMRPYETIKALSGPIGSYGSLRAPTALSSESRGLDKHSTVRISGMARKG